MRKRRAPNRLASEKSPYLQQHAFNPVDWYPWGEEAFEKARAQDKPIFLSIGYSTCHWCHVMKRESFEDDDVARLMNKTFVAIKVDREERPDIDDYYMTACQMLTGTGGWPLTIIMNPEKKPFFAATYLPRESRYGRVGLLQLIPRISTIWQTQKASIVKSAEEISTHLKRLTQHAKAGELSENILRDGYNLLNGAYDRENGGFGNAPKFPTSQNLLFLLRYFIETKEEKSLKMAEHTLKSMRMGGLYDHIGYGFHRYSTDSSWHLPHFEKMLYDQALLTIVYCEAFQITKDSYYRDTVRQIITYVLRDMKSPEGVFYSAEDAESEGEEGKYYLWTEDEIRKILGPSEYDLIVRIFNIKSEGNYDDEISRIPTGRNLLYMTDNEETLARELDIPLDEFTDRMNRARRKMFAYRVQRIPPHKDKKVLCDWNGLMIAALSRAARIFDNEEWQHAAKKAADFILTNMRTSQADLYHRYIDGQPAIKGFLDDYASLIWGLIELYQATFETSYMKSALELNERTLVHFWDEEGGAFFFTSEKGELPVRRKEAYDSAIPSGNSVAASNQIRLGRLTGLHDLQTKASMILNHFGGEIRTNPLAHMNMLVALNQMLSSAPAIVIYGDLSEQNTVDMIRTVNNVRILDASIFLLPANRDGGAIDFAPSMKAFVPSNGKTTAYVCRNYRCETPTCDIKKLSQMLTPPARGDHG